MKKPGQVILIGFAFVAGMVAGGSGCYIYFDREENAEKAEPAVVLTAEQYAVCRSHQGALYQRAGLYRQKFGRWPTNVQELVEAHYLPEYSQVHLCPSQIAEIGLITSYDPDSTFIEKNHRLPVGYYASSPYRFGFDGTNFTVICTADNSHNARWP
jgi:hypothetical protein